MKAILRSGFLALAIMLATTLTMLFWPQFASATYINNYSDWKELGYSGQATYAMGLYDGELGSITGIDWTIAKSNGLSNCGVELGLIRPSGIGDSRRGFPSGLISDSMWRIKEVRHGSTYRLAGRF